jgi:hypothetical protein
MLTEALDFKGRESYETTQNVVGKPGARNHQEEQKELARNQKEKL